MRWDSEARSEWVYAATILSVVSGASGAAVGLPT